MQPFEKIILYSSKSAKDTEHKSYSNNYSYKRFEAKRFEA